MDVKFNLMPGFSLANAKLCVYLSKLAYTETPTICDQATDTNVLVVQCSNAIAVAFQGTKDLRQWIQDAKAWHLKDEEFIDVHAGFAQDYRAVAERVRHAVMHDLPPLPVYLMGHSKGAAEASLCAYDLSSRGFAGRIHSVYTFGQPRTGGRDYAKRYNELLGDKTYR